MGFCGYGVGDFAALAAAGEVGSLGGTHGYRVADMRVWGVFNFGTGRGEWKWDEMGGNTYTTLVFAFRLGWEIS